MMTDIPVYPMLTDSVLSLLRDGFGDFFKSYFDGDPIDIAPVDLPAICVITQSEDINTGATGTDEVSEVVTIRVILNKMDDFGGSDREALTHKRLKILVKGRNPNTRDYLPNSVMGILRTQFTVNGQATNQTAKVVYEIQSRSQDVLTEEATITFSADMRIAVTGRIAA